MIRRLIGLGLIFSGFICAQSGMDLMSQASGTSMNPASYSMPMSMSRVGPWSLMSMGQAFVIDTQQSGPRGGDKFYSTNWFMGAAQRSVAGGTFQMQSDAEPRTGHRHRPPLSGVIPDRRDRLREATGGRAASAQFHHGSRDSNTSTAGSRSTLGWSFTSRRWATPRWDRWHSRIAPRPRNCRKRPSEPPLAGFDAYRRRCGHRWL